MSKMTPQAWDRFQKIVGLLGSDHSGERSNAAALATGLLREFGLTWGEVFSGPPTDSGRRQPPPPPPPADDDDDDDNAWRAMAQAVLDSGRGTAWEKNFCADLLTRGRSYTLSEKQQSKLDAIFNSRVTP